MRCCTILASSLVLFVSTTACADFINIDGTQHIFGSAFGDFGFDSFEHEEAIPPGFNTDFVDNAYTPGDHTWSGVATLTDIGPDYIDLRGFANGHTSIDEGFITALADVSLTFTIETKRLVLWDYFTITDEGTFAGVFLTDPDGNTLLPGAYSLEPGEYTISAFCGYTDLHVLAGEGTITTRFVLTLEQIPAPGALAMFGVAGLLGRSHRRR